MVKLPTPDYLRNFYFFKEKKLSDQTLLSNSQSTILNFMDFFFIVGNLRCSRKVVFFFNSIDIMNFALYLSNTHHSFRLPDAHFIASADHIGKLLTSASTAGDDVADRLVIHPPGHVVWLIGRYE
jgi:hypothetical protein